MEHKKHILILGAGLMQRPAIESAKALGFHATVIDANPNAAAIPGADRFEQIDLKDREAVRDFALVLKQTQGLDAIFTAGTDFSASVSYAAQGCALPAHSFEAALNASDKIRMRGCFKKHGVPSPEFFEVDSRTAGAIDAALSQNLVFPLVVKPVDNMGARGCRLARNTAEFRDALNNAASSSRSGRVVVEEYMEGPEFSVDALVYNGTLTICGFADRHIFYPPYFIEMGHTMPSAYPKADIAALVETFAKGAAALGLSHGAAKGDLKLTPTGPMIGEIAGRLSGGYMSGWTYPYASDCNLTAEAIRIAAGEKPARLEARRTPFLTPHPSLFTCYDLPAKRVCAERAWVSIPGHVREIAGLEDAAKIPNVRDVLPRIRAGDAVTFPRNNVEKCGNIIAVAEGQEQAAESALTAVKAVTLRLEPGNPGTERFLAGETAGSEAGFPPDAFPVPSVVKTALERSLEAAEIPANSPALSHLPECLALCLDSLRDWNSLTLREAVQKFDRLCPQRPALPAGRFWRACVRGSVQGMLYIADTVV
ncbi:MAG: ATP-grasp domain-containing protein [Treponema sp.]|jgi:biotin carboxylase|nr:ATP-grasp domain-containing protein [Treponema sp.]